MNLLKKSPSANKQLPAVSAQDSASARRYHDVAAAAAQHVADMEAEIISYRTEAEALKVDVRALEAIKANLETELAHVRNECDYYRRKAIGLESRLKSAATIIVDILRESDADPRQQPEPAPSIETDMRDLISSERKGNGNE